ncbi:integral membrane protein, partial [mine drainage metagenome]
QLGAEYDTPLIESFLAKVEHEIEARVDARLDQAMVPGPVAEGPSQRSAHGGGTELALGSIALGIPVTAVAASNLHGVLGFAGVAVAWAAIAVINVARALGRRR